MPTSGLGHDSVWAVHSNSMRAGNTLSSWNWRLKVVTWSGMRPRLQSNIADLAKTGPEIVMTVNGQGFSWMSRRKDLSTVLLRENLILQNIAFGWGKSYSCYEFSEWYPQRKMLFFLCQHLLFVEFKRKINLFGVLCEPLGPRPNSCFSFILDVFNCSHWSEIK